MDGQDLGRRIRRARERARLTQRQLADAVGVDRKTVGNWESGASHPRSSLGRLESVLGRHGFTIDEEGFTPSEGADAVLRMVIEVLDSSFSPSVQVQMIRDIIDREYVVGYSTSRGGLRAA
ncbi:MAG TPA: helix-turn-helix domain-containing protein [Natronosporangium sp.]|nr:helix-turn-helix domain-containing protein [Natronosporangium sp.]